VNYHCSYVLIGTKHLRNHAGSQGMIAAK